MRIASTVVLSALALFALACGASDEDPQVQGTAGAAGAAGGGVVAGAGGGVASAGANSAGSAGAAAGSAGSAGAAAGSGGASAGSGGTAGSAGSSGSAGSAGSSGGSAGAAGSTGGSGGAAAFALTSPAFANKQGCSKDNQGPCDKFPLVMVLPGAAAGGMNKSPELNWTAGPAGTLSYAIVLHDESGPYTHWAVWNIPGTTNKLPASLPAGPSPAGITGAVQAGFSGNDKNVYSGPGAKMHVYQFKVYALKVASISPNLPANEKQIAVRTALEASADVIAEAELRGATNP